MTPKTPSSTRIAPATDESAPDGEQQLPGVLIYTPHLLSLVQHYVREHAAQLKRYHPALAGRRRVEGISYDAFPSITMDQGPAGRIRELRFLLSGRDSRLTAFARQHCVRLIHAHFGPGGVEIMPLARRLRVPLVVTFHGWDVKLGTEADVKMSWYEQRYRRLLPQLFHQASAIICVSDSWRERVIRLGCPPHKVRTNYLGIDTSFFDGVRGHFDPMAIFFVGRLVRRKGVHTLLEALRLLHSRGVRATLTVVGEGPERGPLQRTAEEQNLPVRFLGKRALSEIRELLREAAVLCAPSVTSGGEVPEALGLVLLEAQAMSVPVIGTRNGGIPEALQDGITGFLVDEESPVALADALEKLLGDRAVNLSFGERARAFVCEHFDIARWYARLEDLYDELLKQGR